VQESYGGEQEVNNFVNKIMPMLLKFAESEEIVFLEGENKKDFMTAIYNLATWRGKIEYGTWPDDFENELRFSAGFWCALPWWPKIDDTREKLSTIREQFIKNAYNKTIVNLAIQKTVFFEYDGEKIKNFVQKKIKPPDISINLNINFIISILEQSE
jgi:hypothetical protein